MTRWYRVACDCGESTHPLPSRLIALSWLEEHTADCFDSVTFESADDRGDLEGDA